jgi:hypothetical protein
MATVTKDFRIKSGLVVEGTSGTINGSDIITAGKITSGTNSGIAVTYSGGNVNLNVNDPTITISGDVDGNATMTNLGDTTINVTLDTVNSAVGTYGTSTAIPAITVDAKGRVTNVTTNSISTTLGIAGDTGTDNVTLGADTLTFEGGTGITSTVSNNKVKLDIDSTVATLSDQQTLSNKVLGTNVDLGANLDAGLFRIVNLGAPDQATDAATKAYVDSVTEGLHIHPSAVAATTTNISISNDLQVGDILDGVTLAATNRVLVKNQSTASENGIYVVQETGAAIRAADFDQPSEVDGGDFIFVTGGNTNDNTGWVQTSTEVVTIGTDPIYFTQFSGAGTYTAGTGLDLNGNEFVLDLTEASTTTLPEGTNLYFTNQRAVDALQAVVPDFTEIEVNNIARQVAATVSASTAATAVTAFAFAKTSYRSAKFLVKVAYGSHTEVSEVLLTLDTADNIAITEYAVVGTNGSSSAISADIDGTNVRLRVTPVNNSSTVSVFGTLIV